MDAMARRPTKLQFYEQSVTCPYCGSKVIVISVMETILAARRHCPVCKREMLIENGQSEEDAERRRKENTEAGPIADLETEILKCRTGILSVTAVFVDCRIP